MYNTKHVGRKPLSSVVASSISYDSSNCKDLGKITHPDINGFPTIILKITYKWTYIHAVSDSVFDISK